MGRINIENRHSFKQSKPKIHSWEEEKSFPSVVMSTHDNAVIGTVSIRIPGDYESGKKILINALDEIAKWVEEAGGLIGHIKAFIKEENRNCMISIPEYGDIQEKERSNPAIYVENANIVFGVDIEKFEDVLKEIFKEYLK